MTEEPLRVSLRQRPWYGDTQVEIDFPKTWDITICQMPGHNMAGLTNKEIAAAFANPIGTSRISSVAKGKSEVAILFDDLSRPTKAVELVPHIINELHEAGIDLANLSHVDYLRHHDDVARTVLKGEYDAGAVMKSVADEKLGEGLVILATSPPVPEFNFSAGSALGEEERKIVREGLLALGTESAEGRKVLSSLYRDYSGFVVADDGDYDGIRKMMRKIGLLE